MFYKIIALLALLYCTQAFCQDSAGYDALIRRYRYYKPDSAVYFAEKGIAYARMHSDSNGVGAILVQLGIIDDNNGKSDIAEKKYHQALDIFKVTGFKKGMASVLIRLGVVELRNGNYDKAIGRFLEALKNSEAIGDKAGIMEANYSISWAYLDQKKNLAACEQYLNIAEQINQQIPLSSTSLNIYNNYGILFRYKKEYAKAKFYLEKGIALSDKIEYQGLNITMINNLASVYSEEGNMQKAVALQLTALEKSRQIKNYLRELQSLNGLSRTYAKSNPMKAIGYLDQAVALARNRGAHKQETRYMSNIADLYKAQGKYKEAYETKAREHEITDSFFYQAISHNIESLKAEYELEKSKARIKELSYISSQKQLELQQSTLVRNITFGGIIVLVIILAMLYNQYRIKQRNNREMHEKNASLEQLVNEKEWLLKEIHHRVKNNLQIAISLLNTQSVYLNSEEAVAAIQQSGHRMQAMALIHQKLYQTDNMALLNMPNFVHELADYLRESFNTGYRIQFHVDIDPIELEISQTIPIGLILNETITNAIKYAFPDNAKGVIYIRMREDEEDFITLEIQDTGKGLPYNFNDEDMHAMGMRLIKVLTQQLEGQLSFTNENGLLIRLEFMRSKPALKPAKRAGRRVAAA
ncbi:tetratricopeptide repeat protein [Deminuibacter soli]|uniref:histidine kinase n=1 Tax=Deminuibacter soli TaxID=2291815 RepID=A0A3E1NRM3_9BACT|nr:tetratricopeptide repeat protein [Deminuibacter soli]RFM30563.1 hypothetical protein DXN05_06305 [Deminuibacter soli]